MKKVNQFVIALAILTLGACSQSDPKTTGNASAPTMYYGGDIITMEGDQPQYAEAVVAQGDKIVFVGAKADADKKFPGAQPYDLHGKTMLPGFIDAHGHLFNAGFQALSADLLPPPDGKGKDIAALIQLTKDWQAKNQNIIDKAGWIIGFGYDDAQLAEKRHPEAADLDKISTEIPVLIIHQSGHLGVMNSKGLEMAGYKDGSPDPKGGIIRRIKGTQKPNGTLEEMAMFIPLFGIFGKVDDKGNETLVKAGIEAYVKYGFTTAQEGRATKAAVETYRRMADKNELSIDVDIYPDIQAEGTYLKEVGTQKEYANHFRVAGVKLSMDGSPQGKTAWLTKPYKVPPPGQGKSYNGYPAIPDEQEAVGYVETAFANNWQILTHCNGDAAGDLYVKAVRQAANKYGNNDRRSVMIHAQTVREDQLDSMKVLGIIPSFFGMHTFYWGDWHRDETLGKERAYRISPAQSAIKRGMVFTQHHDAPVANPDAIRVLWSVVNRVSRSGDIIGPDQRLSAYQGLKSITDWAAYQTFNENLKGTLKAGKLADFVILDKNPLKVAPMDIQHLQVLQTIKEGKPVYVKK